MENLTLIIGNKNYSSWSLRAWILLKYFGIPFQEILIPLYQGDYQKEILKHSPAGKVPVLKHGSRLVWESLAIAEYLTETFPEKRFWPEDPQARATARSVSAEMHAGFAPLRSACPMNIRENKPMASFAPEVGKDIDRIAAIWDEARQRFGRDGDFLFGAFSIADAMFAPVIWRFKTYAVRLQGESFQYFNTMLSLPAMQEWQSAALKEPWSIS